MNKIGTDLSSWIEEEFEPITPFGVLSMRAETDSSLKKIELVSVLRHCFVWFPRLDAYRILITQAQRDRYFDFSPPKFSHIPLKSSPEESSISKI